MSLKVNEAHPAIEGTRHDLRDNLYHFRRISRTPETAFEMISLERTAFSSSTIGSMPSSLSVNCPFAMALIFADEFGLVLFLPGASPSSPNEIPFGIPFWPFCATRAETLLNNALQSTITTD